jgi:hypothetical protein
MLGLDEMIAVYHDLQSWLDGFESAEVESRADELTRNIRFDFPNR